MLFGHKKISEILSFATKRMKLEDMMVNQISWA
jgi:hypothetical protein